MSRAPKAAFGPGFEPFSSLLAMRFTSRCVASSSCLILLAFPDSAGGGLDRARVVPRAGSAVLVFSQNNCSDTSSVYSSAYTQISSAYQFTVLYGRSEHRRNLGSSGGTVALFPFAMSGRGFESKKALVRFFFRVPIVFTLFFCLAPCVVSQPTINSSSRT